MASVLLDTSFCIRLIKADDPYHNNTVEYFQYFLDNKIELILSTIVIAEYSVKDDIKNLPLNTMKIIPFDFFDAKIAGAFYSILLDLRQNMPDRERNSVKDDCKLLAQIHNRNIDSYITKDRKSFKEIIEPIININPFKLEQIDLSIPLMEYRGRMFE
jgi:hypothetical protein